jgi:hypothetical protein
VNLDRMCRNGRASNHRGVSYNFEWCRWSVRNIKFGLTFADPRGVAIAEVYACDDSEAKFVRDFVATWDKVGKVKWTGTAADLIFGSHSQFRSRTIPLSVKSAVSAGGRSSDQKPGMGSTSPFNLGGLESPRRAHLEQPGLPSSGESIGSRAAPTFRYLVHGSKLLMPQRR